MVKTFVKNGVNTIGKVKKRNRNIQKEPYKRTKAKEPGLQQQQHKSRFLEASLVRQADGKLKAINFFFEPVPFMSKINLIFHP